MRESGSGKRNKNDNEGILLPSWSYSRTTLRQELFVLRQLRTGESENRVSIQKANSNNYNKTRLFKYYVGNHMDSNRN